MLVDKDSLLHSNSKRGDTSNLLQGIQSGFGPSKRVLELARHNTSKTVWATTPWKEEEDPTSFLRGVPVRGLCPPVGSQEAGHLHTPQCDQHLSHLPPRHRARKPPPSHRFALRPQTDPSGLLGQPGGETRTL